MANARPFSAWTTAERFARRGPEGFPDSRPRALMRARAVPRRRWNTVLEQKLGEVGTKLVAGEADPNHTFPVGGSCVETPD